MARVPFIYRIGAESKLIDVERERRHLADVGFKDEGTAEDSVREEEEEEENGIIFVAGNNLKIGSVLFPCKFTSMLSNLLLFTPVELSPVEECKIRPKQKEKIFLFPIKPP